MSDQGSSATSMPTGLSAKPLTETVAGAPIYFAVSPLKLVLMSFCTIGLYELYWFYKNWSFIRERDHLNIMPFGRAFFAYFFCYALFKDVQASAHTVSLDRSISPGLSAAAWIIVTLCGALPDPYWLATYLAVFFLLPVQKVVNDMNESVAPGHHKNGTFTGWNIAALVVGGLFFVLIVLGTFMPEE